jgi:hypothetical protein
MLEVTMTGFRVAIFAILLAPSAANAGPVAWSYTSTSTGYYTDPNSEWYNINAFPVSGAGYGIDPASGTFVTELGGTQNIFLTSGVQSPWLTSPVPLKGPTLWARVELMEIASGEAYSFRIPIEFYNSNPAPWGEWDTQEPRLGIFPPGEIVLGRHKFQVTKGPELTLNIGVSAVPEPATLLLGVVGLAGVGFVRRRTG